VNKKCEEREEQRSHTRERVRTFRLLLYIRVSWEYILCIPCHVFSSEGVVHVYVCNGDVFVCIMYVFMYEAVHTLDMY
jgi:hypothetical protein